MTKSGRFSRRQNRISFAKASSVLGSTQNCAGPPTRRVVCFASGSDKSDLTFGPDDFFQLFRDDQLGREPGQLFVHIAGAETEHQIAIKKHLAHVAVQPIKPRLVRNRAMSVLRDRVGNRLAGYSWKAGSLAG